MDKKGSLLNSQDADLRRRPTKKQTRQRPMIFHTPAGSSNVNNEFMKPRRKQHAASTTPRTRSAKKSTPAATRQSPRFETPQSMVMAGTPQSGISSMQASAKRSASSAKASSSSRKRAQTSARKATARKTPRQVTPSSGSRQASASGQQQQRRPRATASTGKSRQAKRGGKQAAGGRSRGGNKDKAAASKKGQTKSKTAPKTSGKKKKKAAPRTSTHLDPDYSPENALRLYSLDADARRSVTSITDLDTAVAAVDECFFEAEDSVDSNVVKMALREIADEFRYHALDMVELIQELKTVQRSLRRANTQSNKLRQALLEVQTERSALSADIDQMRKNHERKDALRKATEDAHDYITRCERMHARAMRRGEQEEEKDAAATQLHNTTANLVTVRALVHSAPALKSSADRLAAFLQNL